MFAAQIALALEHDLALVIHTREAWDDTFAILGGRGRARSHGVPLLHRRPDEARSGLDLGIRISFSGIVTFKTADDLRAAAAICPLDRLLVETDSPYLAPVPHRGKKNRPALVPLVGAAVAEAKGIDVAEVAAASSGCRHGAVPACRTRVRKSSSRDRPRSAALFSSRSRYGSCDRVTDLHRLSVVSGPGLEGRLRVDDSAAHRRRVFLGAIMVVAFALLVVAALIPTPHSRPLSLEQAGADETVPESSAPPTTEARAVAPSTTATTEAPTTTVADKAPTTTSTTEAPAKVTAVVKTDTTTRPVTTAPPEATPPPASIGPSDAEFLACIRMRESHNDYTTVSASGNYRGAYQFNQPAWDSTARHAGRPDLVGRLANTVAPADQDALALDLYHWQGSTPWGGACD